MNKVELYMTKKRLIEELESITLEMKKKLESGDVEHFFNLTNDRQKVMKQVDDIKHKFPLGEEPEDEDTQSIQYIKGEISALLQNIIDADKIIGAGAEETLENIKTKIKRLAGAKAAVMSYTRKPVYLNGFFVEKKK